MNRRTFLKVSAGFSAFAAKQLKAAQNFSAVAGGYVTREENGLFNTDSSAIGPYLSNGKYWCCFHQVIDDGLGNITRFAAMFVSSDAGATWAEADAAHHPQIAGNNVAGSGLITDGAFDGHVARANPSDFYCGYVGTDGTSIKVTHFSFATGVWGATDVVPRGADLTWFSPAGRLRILCLKANTRFLFFDSFVGGNTVNTSMRVAYFDGASWSNIGDNNYFTDFDSTNFIFSRMSAICADSTESFVHMFIQAISRTGTGDALWHRSVTGSPGPSIAFGALFLVKRFDPGNTNGYVGQGSACTAFGNVFNIGMGSSGALVQNIQVYALSDIASPGSVVETDLVISGTGTNGPFIGSVSGGHGGGITMGTQVSAVFDTVTLSIYYAQTVAGFTSTYFFTSIDGSTFSAETAFPFTNLFGPIQVDLPSVSPLGFVIQGIVVRKLPAQSEGDLWIFRQTASPPPPPPTPTQLQNYVMSDNPNFLQKTNFIRSN